MNFEFLPNPSSHPRLLEMYTFFMSVCALIVLVLRTEGVAEHTERPARCDDIPQLAVEVSKIRGLAIKGPIRCIVMPREKYLKIKEGYLVGENADRLAAEEIAYKQIGIIDKDFAYRECLAEAYSRSLIASYDSQLQAILLLEGQAVDRSILAHELVHALQDQHFGLASLQEVANQSSDSALALGALVEGDALYVQQKFSRHPQEDKAEPASNSPNHCPQQFGLEAQFDFPYGFGFIYASNLASESGMGAINRAFANPVRCSSAILHHRNGFDCPDWRALRLSSDENAWIKSEVGERMRERFVESLGEYTLGLILSPELGRERAILSAKGWSGDKLVLWQGPKGHATSLIINWNNPDEALEFVHNFNISAAQRFGVSIDPRVSSWQFSSGIGSVKLSQVGARVGILFGGSYLP